MVEWDVIHRYTRAQALADGMLVDVSEVASEAGFCVPVAVTQAVWHLIVPNPAEQAACQDLQGRLWDTLYMAFLAIRRRGGASSSEQLLYRVIFQLRGRDGRNGQHTVTLKILSGPGDEAEHVITIMFPEED